MFKLITKSDGRLDRIQSSELTQDQVDAVRWVMKNCWMDSEDYKVREPSGAFLQSQHNAAEDRKDGWIMIEFWTEDKEKVLKFIDYLNKEVFP